MIQWHVVTAVFKRNIVSYFINPVGYLFITAFVWACAYFAFWHNDTFFANNLADLEPLNTFFPLLLLFFIPAITMTAWAEERRSGTEELLLTLPAGDFEIVLGKYLACLGIYTIALGFSLTNVLVLYYLGRPDLGLIASTYLGYFLIGAALIAAGMFASQCTSSTPVAFILGAGLCLLLVSTDHFASILPPTSELRELLERVGIVSQFQPFGKGLVSLAGVLYFFAIAAVFLYANMWLLSRRHWAGSRTAAVKWIHLIVRTAALGAVVGGLTILATRANAYLSVDTTTERIHSLSPETRSLLTSLDPERPVLIEAFISPRVPKSYVETRRNLLDTLRQFSIIGGKAVEVRIYNTELYSEEARAAETNYGIRPEVIPYIQDGRTSQDRVFLGIALKSGLNERVIPFFYRGLPIEYELMRAIRTVAERQKRRVGVLNTDASFFGNFDMQRMQPGRDWQIIGELKHQYEVLRISPTQPITEQMDCLIVPMASSLTQGEMENLLAYVRSGKATLILDDAFPQVNPALAPREPKQNNQNPMMGNMPPGQKGNMRDLLMLLGIYFDVNNVLWKQNEEFKQFPGLPPEFVILGNRQNDSPEFSPEHPVSSGLQTLVMLFPGGIRHTATKDGPTFSPLLTVQGVHGTTLYSKLTVDDPFFGKTLNQRPPRLRMQDPIVVAAWIHGPFSEAAWVKTSRPDAEEPKDNPNAPPAEKGDNKEGDKKETEEKEDPTKPKSANVIFVSDLDLISDDFFMLREAKFEGQEQFQFDNVTFILNCVDFLAGDETFIELRKRRPQRRTLSRLELLTQDASIGKQAEIEKVEQQTKTELDAAQADLDKEVRNIEARTDLNPTGKEQLKLQVTAVKQKELERKRVEIEEGAKRRIEEIQDDYERSVRKAQNQIKWYALLLPVLPTLLIGLLIFIGRQRDERENIDPERTV